MLTSYSVCALLSCARMCVCARATWTSSSFRVCHSSSIIGKQQDGAMESSQTKGNAHLTLRVGGRVGGQRPHLQEWHLEAICTPCQMCTKVAYERPFL